MRIFFKEIIIELINTFEENNFKCFIVGGAVRDLMLGITPKEFDFSTDANPTEIKNIFKKHIDIGEKNGCIKIFFKGEWFEITTFRKEYDYVDFRHPSSVEFVKSPFEDCIRRDFKINSMYLNLSEFIDPLNGLKDLENKIIYSNGNANLKFKEDPLRILRGIYLKSKLNFKFHFLTLLGMIKNRNLISKITKFRIHDELKKIFSNEFSIEGIKILNSLKIFQIIFKSPIKILNLNNLIKSSSFHFKVFCILYFHSDFQKEEIINSITENFNFNKKQLNELKWLIDSINHFENNSYFIKFCISKYNYDFSKNILEVIDFYIKQGTLNKFYEIKWGYSPIKISHLKIQTFKFSKNKERIKSLNNYLLTLIHKYPNLNEKNKLIHLCKTFKF